MHLFTPLSLALLASIGAAIIPGGDNWLFSALMLVACVAAVAWAAIQPKHAQWVTRGLYAATVAIAVAGLAFTLWNATPKLLDPLADMPVAMRIAPESVEANATLDATATLVRSGAPLGWRVLWFAVEVLPFVAASPSCRFWPLARDRKNHLTKKCLASVFRGYDSDRRSDYSQARGVASLGCGGCRRVSHPDTAAREPLCGRGCDWGRAGGARSALQCASAAI
jgi:hypothetical protein